jgi:hypothetical protein
MSLKEIRCEKVITKKVNNKLMFMIIFGSWFM